MTQNTFQSDTWYNLSEVFNALGREILDIHLVQDRYPFSYSFLRADITYKNTRNEHIYHVQALASYRVEDNPLTTKWSRLVDTHPDDLRVKYVNAYLLPIRYIFVFRCVHFNKANGEIERVSMDSTSEEWIPHLKILSKNHYQTMTVSLNDSERKEVMELFI